MKRAKEKPDIHGAVMSRRVIFESGLRLLSESDLGTLRLIRIEELHRLIDVVKDMPEGPAKVAAEKELQDFRRYSTLSALAEATFEINKAQTALDCPNYGWIGLKACIPVGIAVYAFGAGWAVVVATGMVFYGLSALNDHRRWAEAELKIAKENFQKADAEYKLIERPVSEPELASVRRSFPEFQ